MIKCSQISSYSLQINFRYLSLLVYFFILHSQSKLIPDWKSDIETSEVLYTFLTLTISLLIMFSGCEMKTIKQKDFYYSHDFINDYLTSLYHVLYTF
jgi:hypothetical protein